VLYARIVTTSELVAATSKRSQKVALLAEVLREAAPGDVPTVVGLLTGALRQGRIGVGWASAFGGRAAPADEPTLTVSELDRAVDRLAAAVGAGSQRERGDLLAGLFAAMTQAEQDHFARLLIGEVRQGANAGVVSDAVAHAASVPADALRRATMMLGDLGAAAQLALTGRSLDVGLQPLVAVQPMLAATSPTVTEALAVTGPASVEWKLDGMRVQAHVREGVVRLFSRGLNDVTASLARVAESVARLGVRDAVLDGEAMGVDDAGHPRRFQDTMSALDGSGAWFFDLLHLEGRSLVDEPLVERRRMLAELVPPGLLLPSIETADPDEGERFGAAAIAAGHEGVVVKALDSPYQAGRRGTGWRKVKPVHTLDLVVLAAEWGHGRRVGWLSNLHLGARGADGFVMVGKTFKGMTDELLAWQTEALQQRSIAAGSGVVHVRPELVVEIALDGVQVSRRYPGGVALRFARVRRYRPDKAAAAADTIERVRGFLG
jgi:DNA ligase-1